MTELVDYHTLWKNYMIYSQRVFELNQENQMLSSDKSLLEMKIVNLEKLIQSEKGQESENSELSKQITELQKTLSISNAEKADLLIKVTDLEESLSNERSLTTSLKIDLQNEHDELLKYSFGNAQNLKLVTSLRKENECLQKKVHELEEDKKVFENKLISSHSRVIELSNQVNDFEKIVIIERSNFEKERRAFEAKINELSLKISVFDEQKENKIFKEFFESTCYVNCCYDDDDSNSYDGMNVFDSLESCTDSCTNKNNVVDSELVKFEKMLQDERKVFEEERKVFEKERKSFGLKSDKLSKKISDLEKQIVNERKDFEKKKSVFESKKKDLKKKSLRVERDRCVEFVFEEETKDFEKERKSFEEKSVLFRKKIANLEVQLSDERSAFKRKEHLLKCEIKGFEQLVVELKKQTFEKSDFEEEKKVYETEVRKLTLRLSELSSDIMKEQIMSSNLKKKLDETVAEKNLLSAMVKDLEDIVFKVNLNEPKSPDVIVQSPYVDYVDSVCSFKTAPSSLHADVSSTKSFTPTNQIRPSNLFYDHQIDGSGKIIRRKVMLTYLKDEQLSGYFMELTDLFGVKGEFWSNKEEMIFWEMVPKCQVKEKITRYDKRCLQEMFEGEIVGCKIGLYPRSQDCAQSEDKGKVKVVFKVKNLNLEYHLQAGLINTNAYDMIRQLRDMFQTQARTERYDATKAFNECKMVKGTSVSDHVMKMKRHLDHLERLGHPVPLQLATDTILNSLSEDYRPFVVNYNMNNMEKTIAELHSMLKIAELNMGNKNKTKDVLMVKDGGVKKKNGHTSTSKGKGPVQAIQSAPKKGKSKGKGKKVKPNKARTENRCFICNEIGHWRQNCPKRHEADSSRFAKHCKWNLISGRNHSSTQQLRKVAVSHIQELELLNNSYKRCRLKVAQIFDRVADIGRDPRLRLLLGVKS
ncbi:hypothetical protein OSB04_024915 [Centaurea solstitialis]|uniref:CCHC-type domain-containing protein n=1 Tax=Centaurea solstitialis TaxID=347529 RepID=A0AA38SUL0_9ASTR|nr:hypothetical protein OSB04_024915 [Centaurea solstitialis]